MSRRRKYRRITTERRNYRTLPESEERELVVPWPVRARAGASVRLA